MLLIASASFLSGVILSAIVVHLLHIRKSFAEKEELIRLRAAAEASDSVQEIVRRDFTRLANEIIKNEQEDLRKQNRESLEEKLIPLTRELSNFRQNIESFNLKETENTAKLSEQINNLERNNKIIEKETQNLVEALTKNQNIKGAYGENLLDTILQACGMLEGVHYTKQFTTQSENLKDEEVHSIRPDIVINLPDDRHLIIDSKVTLSSYLRYSEDNSKLNEFKSEVKKRISDLSNKNYQNAKALNQPDFVIMYMPIEASVSLLYEDTELIMQAYRANVIIAGTASMIAAIRLVNQLLAQQKQRENLENIVKAGTNLYETFVQFCEDLLDVQRKFEEVSSKLTTTINRFRRENKNKPGLFSQINKLKEYGINSVKEIPPELTESYSDTIINSSEDTAYEQDTCC